MGISSPTLRYAAVRCALLRAGIIVTSGIRRSRILSSPFTLNGATCAGNGILAGLSMVRRVDLSSTQLTGWSSFATIPGECLQCPHFLIGSPSEKRRAKSSVTSALSGFINSFLHMELKQDDQAQDCCSSNEQTQSESLKLSDLLAYIGKRRPDDVLSDEVPANPKELRKRRIAEIRNCVKILEERSASGYVYILLEPDADVIRYIGVAVDPVSRYQRHVQSNSTSKTPVTVWIRSLKDRDTLPRMWVICEINTHNWWYISNYCATSATRTIEKSLVLQAINGGHWGNGRLESDLLNVEYVPQNFLPRGIDVQQDQ